jgi:hypothetical protein
MPRPLTAGDAAEEGAALGHTGAALGGEAGGNYENRYCFQRPLVIDRCFWRDDSAGASRRDPVLCPGFQGGVTTDRSPSVGVVPTNRRLRDCA